MIGSRVSLLNFIALLFGVLNAQASQKKSQCDAFKETRSRVYPEKIELESIGKTVSRNAWIPLHTVAPKDLSPLFQEFMKKGYLVELQGDKEEQRQGFVGSVEGHAEKGRSDFSVYFRDLADPQGSGNKVEIGLILKQNKTLKVRINATPSKVEHPVFLLEGNLKEDLKATGLSEKDMQLLKVESAGVMTFKDFLLDERFKMSKNIRFILLGNDTELYRRLAEERIFQVFDTIYQKYDEEGTLKNSGGPRGRRDKGPVPDVTEMFMREITSRYKIVFLIPENFSNQANMYREGKPGYTYAEWLWLKEHPELLKNVTFVVGQEKSIGPSDWWKGDVINSSKRRQHVSRLLADPQNYLLK